MGVITRAYSETGGQIGFASSINRVIDDVYTLQAGNINSANLATSAVGTPNIENEAVTIPKVETAILFLHEVFS
jgi:hypothetical protein